MNIIKIEHRELAGADVQTCNARELWAYVQSKQQFADWIKARVEKFGFVEDQDFTVHKFMNGRATVTDYHLTIDMAKELAMVENNDKGREVRRYFIECERRAKVAPVADPIKMLSDPVAMRSLLLGYTEQVIEQRKQLEVQAPKVAAFDLIATHADGSMCITNAAKSLQTQPKRLFAWMQEHDWIYRRAGGNGYVAYQARIKTGYLDHKITTVERSDGTAKMVEQVLVTAKGLARLAGEFGSPGMLQ